MFREKIKMAIAKDNRKVGNVAIACGMASSSLSSFLNGNRGIKYEHLEKVVQHLGLALVPKKEFHFHSDFMEKQESEREARIAARIGA